MPTFSNSAGVRDSLRQLIQEARDGGYVDEVEFCVADNSEDTATEIVIDELRADTSARINYQRHGQNLGYDRNVDAAVRLASGKYCWLLSDNEDVRPGSLNEILAAIKDHSESGLFIICPENIAAANLKTYANMEAAVRENDWWIPGGLVSRNVIKRSLIPADLSPYYGNDWLHLSITTLVGGDHPVTFLTEKFIHDPNEKSRWAKNGKTFVTYTNLLQIIENLPCPPYSRDFVSNLTLKMRRGLPRNILSSKIYGLRTSTENWRRLKVAAGGFGYFWLLGAIAMIVPPAFAIYGKKIKHSIGN